MLETKFKVAFLLAVLAFAAIPIIGILSGTTLTPFEQSSDVLPESAQSESAGAAHEEPIQEEMVSIPAGPFIRGTSAGGFDEQPQRTLVLGAFAIDRYEVTNFQYQQFVAATGHRKSGPPARYAKNMARMRGPNQPVVYVSWDDAEAYCRWKGNRLPTEAEWEKAMRGTDGRLWPWGNVEQANGANWGRVQDGHDVAASVGSFKTDRSPYGVMDGAGNVMEWVEDWYSENYYKGAPEQNPPSPDYGVFRVLRGGGYTTTGGTYALRAGARWSRIFEMKQSAFAAQFQGVRMRRKKESETVKNLQKIKVVENEKHGQNYIDNHSGQNYNVEQF